MVDLDSRLNSLRVNRDKRLLFPTPESPINTTESDSIQHILNLTSQRSRESSEGVHDEHH